MTVSRERRVEIVNQAREFVADRHYPIRQFEVTKKVPLVGSVLDAFQVYNGADALLDGAYQVIDLFGNKTPRAQAIQARKDHNEEAEIYAKELIRLQEADYSKHRTNTRRARSRK